jgi:hypothetical protein
MDAVAPLKSENHLIDLKWALTTPSKGDISKEALPLVITTLLCARFHALSMRPIKPKLL